MLIDPHAHLTSKELLGELPALLKRAHEEKISAIVNICCDLDALKNGLTLSKTDPLVFLTAAVPPHDVGENNEEFFSLIEKVASEKKLVAIGETGLDYFYMSHSKEQQIEHFKRYLHLATQSNLPIVIHCRDAFADLFDVIDEENRKRTKPISGVIHCFTGTYEEAQNAIARGFYISLSGIVTFKKSEELQNVAKKIPIEHLLLETDSPYLAPLPMRGKRNEPSFLVETAKFVSDLKKISFDELCRVTSKNAITLFALPL